MLLPPAGFDTEAKSLLNPIPFSVRACSLPDLFAGKMHGLLCRRWKTRVKGRDWYGIVWFAANHLGLRLPRLPEPALAAVVEGRVPVIARGGRREQ